MRPRALLTAILVSLGTLGLTTVFAHAQTVSNGPYYATPSWDQKLQCDTQTTCPRFIVLANWADVFHPLGGAAVLDRETGLVWYRAPHLSGLTTWANASVGCLDFRLGGRMGWNLPTIQELSSLVDNSVPGPAPALPPGHPFEITEPSAYWSATTRAGEPDQAWGVSTFVGGGAF